MPINQSEEVNEHVLPLEDVRRFTTSIGHIKNYYVEPVADQKMFDNAIRGMLEGLDPHSTYLSENDFKELRSHTSGEFGGLGLEVTSEEGYVKVVSPMDDTPAAKAGIKAGDLIVRIDGKPIRDMSLKEAVEKMRGKKDSKINLTIIRKGEKKPIELQLTREIIHVASVKSRLLEPGFGYVRLSVFQTPSGADLYKAIKKLQQENKGKLKGMILDLRNNPGGLLDAAIDVADTFIDSKKLGKNKLIVYTEGRIPGAQIKANATPGDLLDGTPLIVLINEGSASASEIVAGALQDHRRAIIVGMRSFGKGSVQTVLPLDEKTAIKLTTARYYTPNGRSIQATGISPDIKVEEVVIPYNEHDEKVLLNNIKEADLDNHLIGENEKAHAANKEPEQAKGLDGKPLFNSDYQLYQALQLLKGLHVVKVH
ncbi:MAG: S41 family peptidase [Legionellales bacterium]|nr:S41 family peptidase [Legionellales bacterium]